MTLSLPRSRVLACVSVLLLVLQAAAGSSGPGPGAPLASADMAITAIVASPSPTVPDGTNLTFTISYINNGPDTPGSTSVNILVPANTTFVSSQVLSGTDWNVISQPSAGGTGNMIWRKGEPGPGAASGETAQFQFVVAVAAGLPNGLAITGKANAYSIDATTSDPVSANNSMDATVNVSSSVQPLSADMAITALTASPSPGAMVGTNITYTIGYINNGPDTPGSTSVNINVPDNTTFVSSQVLGGTGWNVISQPSAGGTGNMIWRKGQPGPGAASGETAQFQFVVQVNASTPHYTAITATANAYSIDPTTADPVSGNNSKTVTTRAMVVADPNEPNDTPATASVLPLGTTSGLIYSERDVMDADWYKFVVPPGDAGKDLKVNVRITSPYPDPPPANWRSDVDWELRDASLATRAVARSASDNETLYLANVTPGEYYIFVGYSTTAYAGTDHYAAYAVTIETGTGFAVGRINGRVVDGGGAGIGGVYVSAEVYPRDWNISFVTLTTLADGTFSILTDPGTFVLSFTGLDVMTTDDTAVNVVDEWYSDKASLATADHFSVATGGIFDAGNVTMSYGAIVSGQVTNQSGAPLANVMVSAYDPLWNRLSYAYTDASGDYELKRVPVGGAKIRFTRSAYVTEWYDDQTGFAPGATLPTAQNVEISGVNAQLEPGGSISGTVKNAAGEGLSVNIAVFAVLGGHRVSTWTSAAGTGAYNLSRLRPGEYKLYIEPVQAPEYLPEWYANAPSFEAAVPITVTEGATTSDIHFVLGGAAGKADFNGDLKADVLWRHDTRGEVWLWPMDGAARTSESHVRTVADTGWEIRAVADFNGDRSPDVIWRNKVSGEVYLWTMNGMAQAAELYVATVATAYDIVASGDFDSDGKADLLWRHTANGELWAWMMDGAARREEFAGIVDPAYKVAGSADFNGDGDSDLLWHNATNGEVWIWLVSGDVEEIWVATVPDTTYRIAGVADFTGDGKADVLWHNAVNGEVWIWTMNGAARVSETWVATVSDTNYQIASMGDYNGDTKADILWWNAVNGEVWMWLMDGTTKVSETWIATVPDVGYRIIR